MKPPLTRADLDHTHVLDALEVTCWHCDEVVQPGKSVDRQPVQIAGSDPPEFIMRPIHGECRAREVLGSVGHQKGLCSCGNGPGTEDDPPGMTKREAARAALNYWNERAPAGLRWGDEDRHPANDAVEKRHPEEK